MVGETSISIPSAQREALTTFLNLQLANTTKAALAVRFIHWNVKGEGFLPAHRLFDEIYSSMNDTVDTVAERITALGGTAEGSFESIYETAILDIPEANPSLDVHDQTKAVLSITSQLSNTFREGIKICDRYDDLISQEICIEVARGLDKFIYFLEASLRA
jgi:starvation-inducible DNA-binding protein